MTGVRNPIVPGYLWGQAFQFPPGALLEGDILVADFREVAHGVRRFAQVRSGVGITRDGDTITIGLDTIQTQRMADRASVWTGFTIIRDGKSFPYRQEFRIPVRPFVTRNPQ